MAEYASQKTPGATSITDLLKLMQGMQAMGKRKRDAHDDMYNEYSKTVGGIYNNTQLQDEKANVEQYLNENRDSMDDTSIDKFQKLLNNYDIQSKRNSDYDVKLMQAKEYGDRISNTLDDFSNAGTKTSFMLDEVTGQVVTEDPAKYGGTLIEYSPLAGEIDSYREDYKTQMKDNISSEITGYAEFSGEFRGMHSDRLSSGAFRRDAMMLENLSEIYTFGAEQGYDDGVFDEEEKQAYQFAIANGSLQPIQNYVTRETNRNRLVVKKLGDEIDELYDEGALYQGVLDERDRYMAMLETDPEAAEELANEQIKGLPNFQYKDFDDSNQTELHNSLSEYETNLPNIVSQIKQKDKTLEKRIAGSYVRDIASSQSPTWDENFVIQPQEKVEKYTKEEITRAQDYIDRGLDPDDTINIKAYQDLGGKVKPPVLVTPTLKHGQLKEADYTKDLVKYKASTKSMVKQVNSIAESLSDWNMDVDEMESFVDGKQSEYQSFAEEEAELKKLGVQYFHEDRKVLRSKSKKLYNEHYNLFVNPIQGASHVNKIKKMVENGELPSWVVEIANAAVAKGISIKEYFEFMKTPVYDKFLDKKIASLETAYESKKRNLESIVKRGSKK